MIQRLYLNRDGIELFIGHLQAKILRVFWEYDTSQGVTLQFLNRKLQDEGYTQTHSTINTTLQRLVKAGHVKRVGFVPVPQSNVIAYLYAPAYETEQDFVRSCLQTLITKLEAEQLI